MPTRESGGVNIHRWLRHPRQYLSKLVDMWQKIQIILSVFLTAVVAWQLISSGVSLM
ncbi:hypothetical protein COCCU_01835 [Corynebacterium occultum]|uniref:Uncharacterized protein n=1 Tax=Corynebacterium occultum TaxID=2675219 RepID=A0A6B8W5Z8_9CORY|nr:hypothetical protein COCCU_01835 [Corynebacterium occultum]